MHTGTYSDTSVSCLLDPSVGAGYSIALSNQWISLSVGVGYAAPRVINAQLLYAGVNSTVLSVAGSGFGASGCAGLPPSQCSISLVMFDTSVVVAFDESSRTFVGGSNLTEPCMIESWTDSAINCSLALRGNVDIPMYAAVTVGGQAVVAPLPFSSVVVTGVSSGQYPPTTGNTVFTVSGSRFGPPLSPVAVLVGSSSHSVSVKVVSHNDTTITAMAPEGSGAGVGVQVFGLFTSSAAMMILSYAAPVVTGTFASEGKPCTGGFPLQVFGKVGRTVFNRLTFYNACWFCRIFTGISLLVFVVRCASRWLWIHPSSP